MYTLCSAALRDAARLAVEAALDVRGIAFERAGVALRPHNGFARPRSGPPRSGAGTYTHGTVHTNYS
eukprot:tig00020801_g13921.t1